MKKTPPAAHRVRYSTAGMAAVGVVFFVGLVAGAAVTISAFAAVRLLAIGLLVAAGIRAYGQLQGWTTWADARGGWADVITLIGLATTMWYLAILARVDIS